MNKKIICIVGPTASGKTGIGVKLANKFSGEIISADSRQVFRKLNIGTNKEGVPKARELKVESKKLKGLAKSIRYINNIPQWMINVCEPAEKYTVFDWLKDAKKTIEDIFSRNKLPIVVGGTGLYVQALCEGFHLSEKLKVESEKKRASRQELEKKSLGELQAFCKKIGIDTTKIDIKNPRRLIRGIEKAQEGIRPKKTKPNFEVLQIGIALPRPVLYENIDKKVEEWFERGLVREVSKLLGSGVDPKWLKSIGLNYGLIAEHLLENNPLAVAELKQIIKFKTHAYARRQLTWLRRFPEIKWARDYTQAEKFAQNFLD